MLDSVTHLGSYVVGHQLLLVFMYSMIFRPLAFILLLRGLMA